MLEDDLATALADAQRAGRHDVDQGRHAGISRTDAYRVQARVLEALGEATGAVKVAVAPDGSGAAAPIYASRVGSSGSLVLSAATVAGLEVEIGFVLARDVTAEVAAAGEDAMRGAIGHYFAGIEIVGTRYLDRTAAGFDCGLADNMSAYGYAWSTTSWQRGEDIDGVVVELEFAGKPIYSAPARHSFGTVLASYFAYARNQQAALPLRAGLRVTTGSLCGLVPTSGPGRAVARLGETTIEVGLAD